MLLAGVQAERRFDPEADPEGGKSDFSKAANLASYVTGSNEQVQAYIDFLTICARDAVEVRWWAVEAIANALLEKTTLQGQEIRDTIDAAYGLPAWRTQS